MTLEDKLLNAVKNDELDLVKYLVSQGADVTANDNEAIISAAEGNHLAIVKYLVSKGADVTADDNEVLLHAVANENLALVKYLVSQGADVTAQNNAAIIDATEYKNLDIVKYLVSQGATQDIKDEYLINAIIYEDIQLIKILVSQGVDIHKYDILIYAIESENLEILKYLVSQGLDVTANDNKAIIRAAEDNNLDLVKYLVSQGADVTAQNNKAIKDAIKYNNLDIMEFLVSKGASIDIDKIEQYQYNDLIINTIRNNNLDILKYLVSQGINIDELTKYGQFLLIRIAVNNNNLDLVKYLVSQGINIDELEYDDIIYSIQNAIKNDNLDLVKYIVSNVALDDIIELDHEEITLAIKNNNLEMVKYLVSQGVDMDGLEDEMDIETIIYAIENNIEIVQYLESNGLNIIIFLHESNDPIQKKIIQDYYNDQKAARNIQSFIHYRKKRLVPKALESSMSTNWQSICAKLGTESLDQLREYANELGIEYTLEPNASLLSEKRLLCKLLAQDLESSDAPDIELNRIKRGECKEEFNLMGDSFYEIPDNRFIKDTETGYCYDMDEIDQLDNTNPYTRVPFSEMFLQKIKEKQESEEGSEDQIQEKRYKIHEMMERKKFSPIENVLENIRENMDEIGRDYFPIEKIMNSDLKELIELKRYLHDLLNGEDNQKLDTIISSFKSEELKKYEYINALLQIILSKPDKDVFITQIAQKYEMLND